MLSYDLFREFISPYYRQVIPHIKKHRVKVLVDSDGDVTEMIPWLIEAGIDGLNPIETVAGMSLREIREKYGNKLFLAGVTMDSVSGTIPEWVFAMFQMTFAIITPALIVGAFAERMKFSAVMLFMALWLLIVYAPICHWVWGGGFLGSAGVLDFAGGTVVHINAGVSALALVLLLGRRKGFPGDVMEPNNIPMVALGAGLLWFGWFGFNAGSALAADGLAANAFVATNLSAAAAGFTWMVISWLYHRPSLLGTVTGAVAVTAPPGRPDPAATMARRPGLGGE